MELLVQLFGLVNIVTNVVGGVVFAPIAMVPGWLSITVISAVLGVVLLYIFKYTSNQDAIAATRDGIKANLLAVKLFKDSISVTLMSQVGVMIASFKLLFYSIIPMLVMIIPVSLILAQMGVWYQERPLGVGGDPAIVKVELKGDLGSMPEVELERGSFFEVTMGPVRVLSKKEVYWEIRALEAGEHKLVFKVGGQAFEKSLSVGDSFMRVNPKRPGLNIGDMFLFPLERPFDGGSAVQSISIDYPDRISYIDGTDWWVIYFFIASMVFAFMFKPLIKVRI